MLIPSTFWCDVEYHPQRPCWHLLNLQWIFAWIELLFGILLIGLNPDFLIFSSKTLSNFWSVFQHLSMLVLDVFLADDHFQYLELDWISIYEKTKRWYSHLRRKYCMIILRTVRTKCKQSIFPKCFSAI